MTRRIKAVAGVAAVAALGATPALAGHSGDTQRGPSTTVDPYVIPVADGVSTVSLLTVDDKPTTNGYKMVGIPDGIGAFRPNGRSFDMIMNHELPNNRGVTRRHGQRGAFASRLTIDRKTLEVKAGMDQVDPGVQYWDYITQTYGPTPSTAGPNPRNPGDTFLAQPAPFGRWCSSTLSAPGQLYNRRTGRGYGGQIYFGNEENGDDARVFGVTEDGQAKQLPRLGLFNWENTKPAFNRSDRTLVMGNEDAAGGQLWVYSGVKRKTGDAFDRAGLTNGTDFVLDAVDQAVRNDVQWRQTYDTGEAADVTINEVDWDQSGAAQNREGFFDGLTLNRIEDGDWDPRHPNDFYFVTTEGGKGADVPTGLYGRDGGGLWKLSLEDIENPELGGKLTLLLDGSEAPFLNKPDNTTIDSRGNLLIQEDPGRNASVARIVAYDLDTGDLGVVAQFDPELFAPTTPPGDPNPQAGITIDEESSGIIEAKDQLGKGWYLFDAQVHAAASDEERVEKGQLLAMHVRSWDDVYGRGHGHDDDRGGRH